MLEINKSKGEFTLDLNEYPFEEHTLPVDSFSDKGGFQAWGVEFNTLSGLVYAESRGRNGLYIKTPVEDIKEGGYLVLRNYSKERIKVIIVPNKEAIRPKEYKFKVTRKESDGRRLRIKILSKETEYEIPWKCTYQGQPISYNISPLSSDKSCHVDIELTSEIYGEFNSVIKFRQDKSNKEIILSLKLTNDEIILEKITVD